MPELTVKLKLSSEQLYFFWANSIELAVEEDVLLPEVDVVEIDMERLQEEDEEAYTLLLCGVAAGHLLDTEDKLQKDINRLMED